MYFNPDKKDFSENVRNEKSKKISLELHQELLDGQTNGLMIDSDAEGNPRLIKREYYVTPAQERIWRDSELKRSDIELNKAQDSDPKSSGTVSQWREYRKSLRAWPEDKDFPSKESRPVAPGA